MSFSPTQAESVKKVVVIGPECTGKTDLCKYLASHFKTARVDEYARHYLDNLFRPYNESDLVRIAHGQNRIERESMKEANGVLICDTNALVVKVWSEFKYGRCDEEILHSLNEKMCDLFLLTYIDVPWEEDPLREHRDKREYFWDVYKNELAKYSIPVVEIKGDREERRKKAVEEINRLLGNG